MGFHFLDLGIIIVIGLLIFGPKTLQSLARGAGKTMSQAKTMKDKLMAELPMDEISEVSRSIPRIPTIPTNPNQAIQMLMTSGQPPAKPAAKATEQQAHQETPEVAREITKD